MNELITKIQGDSTLMLMTIIAFVVLLIIVLTVLVSAMRVKTHKDRFWNVQVDNKEKSAYIFSMEKDLQAYKIRDVRNQDELIQLKETRIALKTTQENLTQLQQNFHALEKELHQVNAKLRAKEEMHIKLMQEHDVLKGRLDTVLEDNTKYRTTNARLLMKLETEERYAQNRK